jgi:hypothetical protein
MFVPTHETPEYTVNQVEQISCWALRRELLLDDTTARVGVRAGAAGAAVPTCCCCCCCC